ncbi:MAG: L-threonine 3-dehydrogenase [Armatimonadetes bacterium JP3_11]|nr:MAG: L-threonine 3-dehydrogenase [Armatimonadetes bacterium CP1_7O]OYT75820.1 MAG: L-threonine 3-dehydrogenase [Armatimonadetes bacterium JP3_11]RMH07957.1 MAG: L-threonine 3-dehydrogenase [Armatimonadota bacterium]
MPLSMKAICKTQPGVGLAVRDVPEPSLGRREVLVRVTRSSICGTDLHIYQWDAWASGRLKPPVIVGHEFCGVVVAVGDEVEHVQVGEFVAAESHIVCGHCKLCRLGQAHVCLNTRILGVDVDGGFAPYVAIPAMNACKTDPALPPEVATVQEPLGNAVHTVAAADVRGATVLITGCGAIGLFSIAVAKALGATRVIATEVRPYRAELATRMGADAVLNPTTDDVLGYVRRISDGLGVDVALEMSGHPASIELITQAIRPGGEVSLLGLFSQPVKLDLNALIFKGVAVHAIVGRRLFQTWEVMQSLLLSGQLDVRPAITHVLPWHDYEHAFELMASGQSGKIVLNWEA